MKRHITITFPITVLRNLPCVLHASANSSSVMWSQHSSTVKSTYREAPHYGALTNPPSLTLSSGNMFFSARVSRLCCSNAWPTLVSLFTWNTSIGQLHHRHPYPAEYAETDVSKHSTFINLKLRHCFPQQRGAYINYLTLLHNTVGHAVAQLAPFAGRFRLRFPMELFIDIILPAALWHRG